MVSEGLSDSPGACGYAGEKGCEVGGRANVVDEVSAWVVGRG